MRKEANEDNYIYSKVVDIIEGICFKIKSIIFYIVRVIDIFIDYKLLKLVDKKSLYNFTIKSS